MDVSEVGAFMWPACQGCMSWLVGGFGVFHTSYGMSQSEMVPIAYLGKSRKYSNENLEDWIGEGFHMKINSEWVMIS